MCVFCGACNYDVHVCCLCCIVSCVYEGAFVCHPVCVCTHERSVHACVDCIQCGYIVVQM